MTNISKYVLGFLLVASFVAAVQDARAESVRGLPREVVVNDVEFVLIPGGWFFKSGGVPSGDEESGGFARIWLDDYYIAKYEAKAKDLKRLLNERPDLAVGYGGAELGCALRRDEQGTYFEVNPERELPATHVSWILADEWSRWMGFRLPSESEWEKAARGPDKRKYPWGDAEPDETYANFATTSDCLVWPVDSAQKGRSPYGIFHMTGNVREIIADALNPDADKRFVDGARNPQVVSDGVTPPGQIHSRKLVKGGRWASQGSELLIATRISTRADDPFQCNGTRFALDVSAVLNALATGQATVIGQPHGE